MNVFLKQKRTVTMKKWTSQITKNLRYYIIHIYRTSHPFSVRNKNLIIKISIIKTFIILIVKSRHLKEICWNECFFIGKMNFDLEI